MSPFSPCDDYSLTVTLPAGYHAAHPNASVSVTMSWDDTTGTGNSDYDLYIFKTPRSDCIDAACTQTDGQESADYKSASGSNPEIANIFPLTDGANTFTVAIVPYTPSGETINVKIEFHEGPPAGDPNFGGPDAAAPGKPRYQNFYAPPGSTAQEGTQGEFNIGYNPKTGRILNMNIGPIWRVTPPELKPGGGAQTPSGLPESCPEIWEDVSDPSTDTGLDPILFTDQNTGRTFATNSTVGAALIYTDSDGGDPPANDQPNVAWLQSAQLPNGGADHETIGTGKLPDSLSTLSNPVNQGEWLVYCSQDVVGPAMCQRSIDNGTSWTNGVPAYTGQSSVGCGGLHGHSHIAPDGTAWLPVNHCGNNSQGGSISTDASGTPWTEFIVQGTTNDAPGGKAPFTAVSQSNGADPSIAIDANNTAYYCYVNSEANGAEGHVHVAVGKRDAGANTIKWIRDVDVGASKGIVNAAETQAVGGSAGRAACGFIGTDTSGNYQAGAFPGNWYAFIATTYDEGKTWTTVNATPNDMVQHATGIWQQGGSGDGNYGNRNLLDFDEMTVDDKGRPLFGYSDGCTSAGCIARNLPNDRTAYMRVARQIGGKTLLAAFDSQTDTTVAQAPKKACLLSKDIVTTAKSADQASARDDSGAYLRWRAPDNGGADITSYKIFRGTSAGSETLLATTPDAKTMYTDTTANPAVPNYFYVVQAVNSKGVSGNSNEIVLPNVPLPPPADPCVLPGVAILTDATGDTSAAAGVVTTPAPPGADLKSFEIAQPYAADGVIKLVFTINTWDSGQAPQPAGSAWYVAFKIVNGTTTTYKGVHMAWTGPTPTFESYTPDTNNSGGVDGRFVVAGSQIAADASSSYTAPFNKVVIVVKASDLGLKPGDTISGFVSGVSQTTDAGGTGLGGATALYDQMPDSLGFTGTFTLPDNQVCRPNQAPVVDTFTADPLSGDSPLTVTFNATAHDPDTTPLPADTIATYHIDFGDGHTQDVSSVVGLQHVYTSPGGVVRFGPKVSVTDSRGKNSVSAAGLQISVTAPPVAPSAGNNKLGGAFPPLGLLLLGALGAHRRLRGQRTGKKSP